MNTMSLNILTKMMRQKEGGLSKCWQGWQIGEWGLGKCSQWLTKGGGGVGEMLSMADEGERGVWTPPFLADIICEQPLRHCFKVWVLQLRTVHNVGSWSKALIIKDCCSTHVSWIHAVKLFDWFLKTWHTASGIRFPILGLFCIVLRYWSRSYWNCAW